MWTTWQVIGIAAAGLLIGFGLGAYWASKADEPPPGSG